MYIIYIYISIYMSFYLQMSKNMCLLVELYIYNNIHIIYIYIYIIYIYLYHLLISTSKYINKGTSICIYM